MTHSKKKLSYHESCSDKLLNNLKFHSKKIQFSYGGNGFQGNQKLMAS